MKKKFVSLIHLGNNMWQKPGNTRLHAREEIDSLYRDYMLTDEEVFKEVTAFMAQHGVNTVLIDMGEGVQLKSHPELAVDGSWSREKFREHLKRLRDLGLTPLPKFNFSCGHNAWMKDMGYKVGLPEYTQFCRDIVNETCELYDGPELFHLGLEEEDELSQKINGHPVRISRSAPKKAEDCADLFETCRKNGARPWMWTDPNTVKEFGGDEKFREYIPRDVVMSNWFYGSIHNGMPDLWDVPNVLLYKKLDEWGYDQIPTGSTWSLPANNLRTMAFARQYLTDERLLGFMTASWIQTVPSQKYGLMHDTCCFELAIKKYYPDA